MASLSVKFQSSTWILMSFSHDWKIRLAVAWILTLEFVYFGFVQFAEFLHCHLHIIYGWIYLSIDPGLWPTLLRMSYGSRCKSPLRVGSKVHMSRVLVHIPCGFLSQFIFELGPANNQNILWNSRGMCCCCTSFGIHCTREYVECLPLQFFYPIYRRNRYFRHPALLLLDSLQDSLLFSPTEWINAWSPQTGI